MIVHEPTTLPRRRTRPMMWVAAAVIVATVAFAVFLDDNGVRTALFFLSSSLVVFAFIRALSPAPGPYGISVRSRTFDVTILAAFAVVIAGITFTLPATALG